MKYFIKKGSTKAVSIRRRVLLVISLLISAALMGEDLWQNHNPYSATGQLQNGHILKLIVNEPLELRYEYENKRDDRVVIKMAPDKKVTDFLPGANVDKSIAGDNKGKLKAKGRIKFRTAVTVDEIIDGETVVFSGKRVIAYEGGELRQEITISGRVNRSDIGVRREINSTDVADLQIVVVGAPRKKATGYEVKNRPGATPEEPSEPAAELSEEERQQLLMEYINRILGESSDR